jgi:hypothetical protein
VTGTGSRDAAGARPVTGGHPRPSSLRSPPRSTRSCSQLTLGDQGTSPWLLPGGQPGRPISAGQLTELLRQPGIRARQSRSAALSRLATDLPAAVLARLPGIRTTVAVACQRASAGDRAAYAAEVSRRTRKDDDQ